MDIPLLGNFFFATLVIHHEKDAVLHGNNYEFFIFDTQSFSAQHCYLPNMIILLHKCIALLFSVTIFFKGLSCSSQTSVHITVTSEFQQSWGGVHRFAFLTRSLVILMLVRESHFGNHSLPFCPPTVVITQLNHFTCESFYFTETVSCSQMLASIGKLVDKADF